MKHVNESREKQAKGVRKGELIISYSDEERRESDAIVADLIIIHAITTNCAKFFHETNRNDAAAYYRRCKYFS